MTLDRRCELCGDTLAEHKWALCRIFHPMKLGETGVVTFRVDEMTDPDRPDETLAPLDIVVRLRGCDPLDTPTTWRQVAAADNLRIDAANEIERLRRLSAEKDAQLAAIEKLLEGNPRDGLLLIDRITALVVQRNADDERCQWWAKNDADLNQRITLADNEVVRLHLALAEKDAHYAEMVLRMNQALAEKDAKLASLTERLRIAGAANREYLDTLAEQSATLARWQKLNDDLNNQWQEDRDRLLEKNRDLEATLVRESTIARMAGNIAAGMVATAHPLRTDEAIVRWSVSIARQIAVEVRRTKDLP